MSHRSRRRIVASAAGVIAVFAALATPAARAGATELPFAVVQPKSSCQPSGHSGGPVDQATVLARAQVWVQENIAYTQACGHDPGGYYRVDCSGFVSMAWELSQSLATWDFNPAYNGGDSRFQPIAQDQLVPGDALVVDSSAANHIALFTGWGSTDHGQHRYANLSEESDFGVGTIAVSNQDLDGSYWGRFTPIHYARMTLPGPAQSSGSSVFVPADASYRVFWAGTGGHLMQTYYLRGAWHTQDLGGVISGEPAVTYNAGRFDVFAVSRGGHLFQRTYASTWGAWRDLGDAWTPGVSAVYVPATDSFYVFGHGPSGHVQLDFWSGYWSGTWQRQDLGGVTAGAPGVSFHDGRFDVFAVSPRGRLFQLTFSQTWGSWQQVGTATYAPGAAAIYTDAGYEVFVRSTAEHLTRLLDDGTGWQGPQDLGGTFDRGPGVTYHGGRYDLFGLASDGIYQSIHTDTWSSWHKVPA